MKLIKWIKNLFKDEENEIMPNVTEKKCKHDWETINKYPFIFYPLDGTYEKKEIEKEENIYINHSLWTSYCLPKRVTDKVCVKCGECYNGFKIMQEHNKKEEERKEYAKQLWEDGCK